MERRENKAEVLIACLFIVLGALTISIALYVLKEEEHPDSVLAVMVIAALSIVCFGVLAAIKFK